MGNGWYKPVFQAGHVINKAELLFDKIEDDAIEKQLQKLQQTKLQNEQNAEKQYVPVKENISYDDFSKMDIRIATVKHAERVPKTDKLLKLTLQVGFEERTVVSGVAHCYQPEELIGKQVCLLANLEPRKIKGIESKGMVLFAEDLTGKLTAVSPIITTDEGSIVK